jgi:hypothetical protein
MAAMGLEMEKKKQICSGYVVLGCKIARLSQRTEIVDS